MDANNQDKLLAIKAALIQTTATQGWSYVKQLANNLVQREVVSALEEEDRDLGESKRLKAQALRKGFADWFQAIEACKSYSPDPDATFGELEVEQAEF